MSEVLSYVLRLKESMSEIQSNSLFDTRSYPGRIHKSGSIFTIVFWMALLFFNLPISCGTFTFVLFIRDNWRYAALATTTWYFSFPCLPFMSLSSLRCMEGEYALLALKTVKQRCILSFYVSPVFFARIAVRTEDRSWPYFFWESRASEACFIRCFWSFNLTSQWPNSS
jgi:hypothetical protein